MNGYWGQLLKLTLSDPREGARAVAQIDVSREVLWAALTVIVALSVIGARIMSFLTPSTQQAALGMEFVSSPIMFALVMWGLLVLTVFCMHYIGRAVGGQGRFDTSLKLVIWLQTILLLAQAAQIVIGAVSLMVAGLLGLGFSLYSIWLFVNFVAVAHGFENRGTVLMGIVLSVLGVVFGLSLLIALIAVLFGMEMPNG
jgi:hypothetical protein